MKSRWPAGLALTTILGSGALVAGTTTPATAGPPSKYDTYHSLAPSQWTLVSYDCAGAVDDGTVLDLGGFAIRTRGTGSLKVPSEASYGGALLRSDRPGLSSLVYPTHAKGSDSPTGLWRVEVGDHVLTSDPVSLSADAWSMEAIEGVVLHEGDWSGTTDDFQAEFGVSETYTAGLMTGGCLGSPTAYVDTVTRQRAHQIVRDLESSTWASLMATEADYRHPIRIRTRLVDESITGQEKEPVAGARMELWRRYLHHGWTRVRTGTTDDNGVARAGIDAGPTARFQWRWAGHQVVSAPVLVTTSLWVSKPRVVGHPGDEPTVPRHQPIVVRGRATAGVGPVQVELFRTTDEGLFLETVWPDRLGSWTVTFSGQPRGRCNLLVHNDPPERLGYASDYKSITVRVR